MRVSITRKAISNKLYVVSCMTSILETFIKPMTENLISGEIKMSTSHHRKPEKIKWQAKMHIKSTNCTK